MIHLLTLPEFRTPARLWVLVALPVGLLVAFPVPIILALIANQLPSERFKRLTQTILYSPSFISVVVVVVTAVVSARSLVSREAASRLSASARSLNSVLCSVAARTSRRSAVLRSSAACTARGEACAAPSDDAAVVPVLELAVAFRSAMRALMAAMYVRTSSPSGGPDSM